MGWQQDISFFFSSLAHFFMNLADFNKCDLNKMHNCLGFMKKYIINKIFGMMRSIEKKSCTGVAFIRDIQSCDCHMANVFIF